MKERTLVKLSHISEVIMEAIIESRKTAVLYRQLARSERNQQKAEEDKKEFIRKLHLASAGKLEAERVSSSLKDADAESKRNQLMVMQML